MARQKKTREELAQDVAKLAPQAALARVLLRSGAGPIRPDPRGVAEPIAIESGEYSFVLFGADHSHGGVIVDRSWLGHTMDFACDIAQRWEASDDPYLRDCANQVRKAQKEAVERRGR